jgi:urocanate hydratase
MPIANIIERSKLPEAQKKIYFEKLKKTGIEPQIMTRQNNTQTQFNVPQGISQDEMHKKMKEHSEKVFEQHRRNTSRPR